MKLIPEPDFPELKRHPVNGVWYVVKEITGKKALYKSTGERNSKTKAVKAGRQILAEYLCLAPAESGIQYKFEDLAKKYLELKKNRRERTIVSAEAHVRLHLMPFFEGYPIANCAGEWENYVAHKRITSPDRKFYNDTKHMRAILRVALGMGVIKMFPTLRCPDSRSRVGKEYLDVEVRNLIKLANTDLSLQIRFAILMGMRRSEILHLSWNRIDLARAVIILKPEDVKTDDGREVPIHSEILSELKERRSKRKHDASPFLFPSPSDPSKPVMDNKTAWQECKRKAGVTGRFHDLRHTAVTRMLYIHNIPSTKVAAIVGMSLAVMNRYAHPKGIHLHSEINKIPGYSGSDE